jgi:hypothetical protein
MLGLSNLLVSKGVFTEVHMCFLPKGHTHDDVDQMFGRIHQNIQNRNILTISDLHDACVQAYKPVPVCHHIEDMGLYSQWMLPYLATVRGVSKPRHFHFKRSSSGSVCHWYRQNLNTDEDWFPTNTLEGLQVFPNGIPDLSSIYCVPKKPMDIRSVNDLVTACLHKLTTVQVAWWKELANEFEEQDLAACCECKLFRTTMSKNGRSKLDDKETANQKRKVYDDANKQFLVRFNSVF